jgi:hypothetical protein
MTGRTFAAIPSIQVLIQAGSTHTVNLATFVTSVQPVHRQTAAIHCAVYIHQYLRRFKRQCHLRNVSNSACVTALQQSQHGTRLNQSRYLLMQGPSLQADSCSTNEFHSHKNQRFITVLNSPQLVSILSHKNTLHTLPFSFFNIHFNTILKLINFIQFDFIF